MAPCECGKSGFAHTGDSPFHPTNVLAPEGSSREKGYPKNTWEMSFKVQVAIFCSSDVVVVSSRLIKPRVMGRGSSRRGLGSTSWCGDIFDFPQQQEAKSHPKKIVLLYFKIAQRLGL